MTRWLWLTAPVLVVTLLIPLTVAAAVTLIAPSVLVRTVCGAVPKIRQSGGTQADDQPGSSSTAARALAFAAGKAGGPYRMGATGPVAYDCSSLVQAAYAHAGVQLPRIAAAQAEWLAAGNGTPVTPGQEQPGDLLFWDSYLGPRQIGHVALVWNPAIHTTIDARNTQVGIGHFAYTTRHHRFEIWRIP